MGYIMLYKYLVNILYLVIMGWDTRKDQILRDHYGKGQKTASEIASNWRWSVETALLVVPVIELLGNIKIKKKLMINK